MSQVNYLHVVRCQKREGDGPHCLHETGRTVEHGRLVARDWTCCYCGEESREEVKPLPDFDFTKFTQVKHGPFAPRQTVYNAAGGQ